MCAFFLELICRNEMFYSFFKSALRTDGVYNDDDDDPTERAQPIMDPGRQAGR